MASKVTSSGKSFTAASTGEGLHRISSRLSPRQTLLVLLILWLLLMLLWMHLQVAVVQSESLWYVAIL